MAFTDISSSIFLIVLAVVLTAAIHNLNLLRLGYQRKQSKPGAGGGCLGLPPGPTPLPIIGCLHRLLVNKPAFRWIHRMMDELNTKIASIRLGRVDMIIVTCPKLGQEFLLNQGATFSSRPVQMSTELPTYGYLTVALTPSGDQWKKMRRVVISEVLSVQRHDFLEDKRMEEADHLTRWVYNMCSDEGGSAIVKVRFVAQHYCGNVIRRMMFNQRSFGNGTVVGGPGPEEVEHVDSLFKILEYINAFSISDCLPWLRHFDFGGHEDTLRTAMQGVQKFNDPIIDQRIQMWRNGTNSHDQKQAQDILDILIQLTDHSTRAPFLTSSEIKAQILELMLATVDNPANAIEWAVAEMINQPKILDKAVEELDQVVGKERLVQESDLPKLNYVKACAKEAFRLHPVYPFIIPHVSTADANVAGYHIPKGSHLLLSRIGLGRNPDTWEDPLQFKPERHLNPDGSQVVLTDPKLSLLSFSTGRRGCPGVLLGSTITTMLLARLLHGFSWTAPSKMSNSVDLAESHHDLSLSKPLLGLATPRLPDNVYPMPSDFLFAKDALRVKSLSSHFQDVSIH